MSQPNWKALANLGDAKPIDYGGYFVLEDTTGVYLPEVELIEINPESEEEEEEGEENQSPEEENDSPYAWVYRFILEKHTFENGVLSDNPYHKDCAVWYAKDLPSVSSSVDIPEEELRALLLSEDPIKRALGYRGIVYHFGPDEFDSYPLRLSRKELAERLSDEKYKLPKA